MLGPSLTLSLMSMTYRLVKYNLKEMQIWHVDVIVCLSVMLLNGRVTLPIKSITDKQTKNT